MSAGLIPEGQWKLLQQHVPPVGSRYAVNEAGVDVEYGRVLIAVDGNGWRHLLIPVADGAVISEDRASAGVQVVRHVLIDGSRQQLFVDLLCRLPHLDQLFSVIVDEVLQEIKASSVPPAAVCTSVLSRWRELLANAPTEQLSAAKLMGLFGELWHLLELSTIGTKCITAWVGPEGHRHDFARGSSALEIKTTAQRYDRRVSINGHEQLEPPPQGTLYLAFVRVERVPDAGSSVPDLITSLLSRGIPSSDLFQKLAKVGYQPGHADAYRDIRFNVLERVVYGVSGAFPRIVTGAFSSGHIPAGVVAVDYVIDLAVADPCRTPTPDLKALLKALAGEGQ